jgi:hypothetical protein
MKGLLDAFSHQVQLVRGRFGSYEPVDFLALLFGYAISGERTLSAFPRRRLNGGLCARLPRTQEGRWYVRAPSLFRCRPANGSAPMRAEAMATIKVNSARALRAITTSLRLFALTTQVALVRLDGQYGDTVAIAQLIGAGVHLVTRARGYRVLEPPQIQHVLAHPPTARVTRVNSDEVVEVFDGGWLQLDGVLPQTRVIVARHRAPEAGKRVSVGKCRGRVGV